MFLTTLCYIEKDDCYLMLHRVKKENDLNHDKWIGVGGKFEAEEMPEECMMREVKEETGLTLTSYRARGVITFISNEWGTEYMHLFTADQFTGEITDCDEGELVWVPKKEIKDLKLWEGDKIFLRLLDILAWLLFSRDLPTSKRRGHHSIGILYSHYEPSPLTFIGTPFLLPTQHGFSHADCSCVAQHHHSQVDIF